MKQLTIREQVALDAFAPKEVKALEPNNILCSLAEKGLLHREWLAANGWCWWATAEGYAAQTPREKRGVRK